MIRRDVRCVFLVASLSAILGATVVAQSTFRPQAVVRRDATVERAVRWVAAVLRHQPGAVDSDLDEISRWDSAELTDLAVEVEVIRQLMRDERAGVFSMPLTGTNTPPQLIYSNAQRERLRTAAHDAVRAGLNDDDLAARGILFHTDIALLAAGIGNALQFADGRELGIERGGDHWATARVFAAALDQRSGRLPDVRFWYRATLAAMAQINLWNATHADAAAAQRPPDAELLFLAGSLHETQASARVQASMAEARVPANIRIRVGSAAGELRLAEPLLRRVLDLSPGHTEARIHYGRVLTLLDRATNAITELQRAAGEANEAEQQYYARLFLGAALEAANRRDEARAAYADAIALFPRAQSPHLSLSQLAEGFGDRQGPARALEPLLQLAANDARREDPWWAYLRSTGRHAEALLTEARQRLVTVGGPGTRP